MNPLPSPSSTHLGGLPASQASGCGGKEGKGTEDWQGGERHCQASCARFVDWVPSSFSSSWTWQCLILNRSPWLLSSMQRFPPCALQSGLGVHWWFWGDNSQSTLGPINAFWERFLPSFLPLLPSYSVQVSSFRFGGNFGFLCVWCFLVV